MDSRKTRNSSRSIPENSISIQKKVASLSLKVGIALILIGAIFFLFVFKQALFTEVEYIVDKPVVDDIKVELNDEDVTKRVDKVTFLSPKFGLAIPKIDANANVLADINPYDSNIYNAALAKGVAHAKGTALPGEKGNVFMFAHSAENFYEGGKYNIYFYLLPKLEKGDKVYVSYNKEIFTYEVEEVKFVNKTDVKYLGAYKDYNTLTLMTCWPAGVDISRVIVIAKEISK